MSTPPLAGIRVLEFGHIVAGPYCARLLADLGADVVKVESRSRPEGIGRHRLGDAYKGRRDRSPHMLMTNRNRRSATLNLKTPAGVQTARRLAAAADVLLENFSAGALDRLGLGWQDLSQDNPRLIYLSLSGYGHAGPRRDWTSMNLNLQAYSGLMMATGTHGEPPATLAASWNDYLGALHGCVAVLHALTQRAQTGRGAHLDLSQFECSVASLGALLMASAANGAPPARTGSRAGDAAPQGCYRCAGEDEWCAISVRTDAQWRALTDLVPGLRDKRFATLAGRLQHHDDLDAALEAWTSPRSSGEAEAALRAAGVPAARMRRTRDVLADPTSSRLFREVEDPPGYRQLMSALPLRFGQGALAEPSRAPVAGEHTAEVLREWLDVDDAEIGRLDAEGALV